ncbi:MAG: hypothetical protein ABIP97_00620, partial [Chthoniobacterales bacterium]
VEERDTIIKRLEAQGLQVLPVDDLEYHRINNGMPTWGRELDENTLPQEARLEDQAVDFHKGCYVGQEVVSRIKSVGRVNRRLFGLESDNLLSSGMVLAPENSPETPVGSITSVSPVFGLSKWIGMGYVKHGFDLPGGRLLASNPENGLQTSVRMREFPIDTAL